MDKNILIVDDDKELCDLLSKCVNKEGINPIVCHNGLDALKKAANDNFLLIVLDIMMPGMDGLETLIEIRKISKIPILMLTAKAGNEDKVKGLRLGADDYLVKPFDINEFLARVDSLIRRFTILNNKEDEILDLGSVVIDNERRKVTIHNKEIELLGKEFDVFLFLCQNHGKVLTKRRIFEEVWKEEYLYDDNNIMPVISRLRRKLEQESNAANYIQTVRGVGYRFVGEDGL